MSKEPKYKALLKRVHKLEKENFDFEKIKQALGKSEKRYLDYFKENISGKYISNPDGCLIDCNQEYERIFGFNNTLEALATPLQAISIDPNERQRLFNMLKEKKQITHYRPKLKKIDGTPIHLIGNFSGVFDENGNLDQVRGFLLDITEQKNLQGQLLQAQKMEAIGTLAGGIAHDFNNILSSIFGYSQLAKLQIAEPEKAEKNIDQIIKGAQRASTLVQQILTFSRQSEYEKKSFKVSALLRETIKLLRASIPANIEIIENIMSNAAVMADSTQIHQVIMNLCTNAYHAMSKTGGTLTIELKEIESSEIDSTADIKIQSGKYLKLSVSDTGHGIDEKISGKIFDPYFTTKGNSKGTGLGLAVVDGIVKKHKGFIKFFSRIGQGTVFEIFWPISEQNYYDTISEKSDAGLYMGSEQIMLVDDEIDIRVTSKAILKQLGYKIDTFEDGVSALKSFTENPGHYDLIITDLTMPNLSGDKLSIEVLKIRKDIPIILCTGYSENFNQEMAQAIGISKYIQKPATSQKLSFTIREVMTKKNLV